eukprot:g718.t1
MSRRNEDGKMKAVTDPRFQRVHTDPRFRRQRKSQTKVKIDNRFKGMFEDPDFNVSSKKDKYGRKNLPGKKERESDLRRFYELDEENDEDQDEAKLDLLNRMARGEIDESSSSESDSEEEDADLEGKKSTSSIGPTYGRGDASTCRLAIVNLDWDKIRAQDLFVLFSSFAPRSGRISSVTVYPSLFGIEEMKKEVSIGPSIDAAVVASTAQDDDSGDNEEDLDDEQRVEAVRQYERRRMMFYFAVVECDNSSTADALFKMCDETEFEHSSNTLEMSFVPDELDIEQTPRDSATSMPTDPDYSPPDFVTTALQQTKNVECSWDRNDYQRTKTFTSWQPAVDALKDNDFSAYLAPCSDSSSSDDDEDGKEASGGTRGKARKLLSMALGTGSFSNDEDEGGDNDPSEAQITFVPNVGAKLRRKIEERKRAENETVFEKYQRERREKRKERKRQKNAQKDDMYDNNGQDFDGESADPFAAWDRGEFDENSKKGSGTMKKTVDGAGSDISATAEEEARKKAELQLLLLGARNGIEIDADEEGERNNSKRKQKKKKKRKKSEKGEESSAATNLDDSRFSELFTNPEYAIDRTNKRFKKSATTNAIMEKSRNERAAAVHDGDEESVGVQSDSSRTRKKKKKKKRGKKKRARV